MKIKVAEATPFQIDWLMAKIGGRTVRRDPVGFKDGSYWIWEEEVPSGLGGILIHQSVYLQIGKEFSPATNWAQGGLIIEREKISICENAGKWVAGTSIKGQLPYFGPTPLIAGLRCHVASILGAEVEVPEDLT